MGATVRWNLAPDMTVVVLAARHLSTLDLEYEASEDVYRWYEPDYGNVLTALAINPSRELVSLRKLPLLGEGVKK